MSEWIETTLGECATFLSGGTPSKNNSNFWGGNIPWISAKDMKSFRLENSEDVITTQGSQNGTRVVPSDSILILVRGMTLHNDIPIGITTKDMAFNQDIKALIPKSHVNYLYLAYVLLANKPFLMTLVDSASHGTGRLNTDVLKNFTFALPPLTEQKRIAEILGALDDKIELNRRMNRTLEGMARALFQSWFVDFDPVHAKARGETPYGMDEATAALFPDSFEETALGRVPTGWGIGTLGKIAGNPRRNVRPEQLSDEIPLGVTQLRTRKVEWKDESSACE